MAPLSHCIYCPKGAPTSNEHWLPRCLGKFSGYEQLRNRVCSECNNRFSVLEEQFCRSGPEAVFREFLGVEGRKHPNRPSPFLRGSAGASPIVLKAPLPDEGLEILWEVNRGTETIRELRQVVLIGTDGESHIIPIPDGMTREEFDLSIKDLPIAAASPVHVFADEDEIEWVESLLSDRGGRIEWHGAKPSSTRGATFTVEVTNRYFRAIAKIGFHYFLKFTDLFTGAEPCFSGLRTFITQGGDVEEFVRQESTPFVSQLRDGMRPKTCCHLLASESDYHFLRVRLHFFVCPAHLPPPYVVRLGRNPSRIVHSINTIHTAMYYPRGQQGDHDGWIEEGRSVNLLTT